jgi:hypothetical protein
VIPADPGPGADEAGAPVRERTIAPPRFPEGTDPWVVAWIAARGADERELSDLVVRVHNGLGKDGYADAVALVRELDPPPSPTLDDTRGYLRLDWTLRELTPALLEAAGAVDHASGLRASDDVVDDASALVLSGPLHQAMAELSRSQAAVDRRLVDDRHQSWARPAEAAARDAMWWSGDSAAVVNRAVGLRGPAPREVAALTNVAGAVRAAALRVAARAVVGDLGTPEQIAPAVDAALLPLRDRVRSSTLGLLRRALVLGPSVGTSR